MFNKLTALNDKWTEESIQRQIMDKDNRYFGGIRDPYTGVAWPSHTGTALILAVWTGSLLGPSSGYYRSLELLARLEEGMDFMLRFQHEDGTISPGWTNYHSPPDTAFVVVGLANVLTLINRDEWEKLDALKEKVGLFLQRTVPAMLTGGVHTPNHRWVLTAALGSLYRIFGLQELKTRADEWLREGMDITPDGEWTERSNGIYNTVSDIMLYYAAQDLERPELLEPVRRNLRMMKYLVHPDGEVVTDYSGRQDFGSIHTLEDYYLTYKLMAEHDQDPEFAAMAELAGAGVTNPGSLPNNSMLGFLLYPQMHANSVTPGKLPVTYRKVINQTFNRQELLSAIEKTGHGGRIFHSKLHKEFGAPVARIRREKTSATVMTETSSFFSLRHGKVRLLGVQLASSFEPGLITMTSMEETEDSYKLEAVMEKGYYGPVPEEKLPPSADGPSSPWYLLPHQDRPFTHAQRSRVHASVTETDEGWKLRLVSGEPSDVLTQVVLLFGSEGSLEGELHSAPGLRETSFWTGGKLRYSAGEDWMELDHGVHDHIQAGIRGMAYPDGCLKVIINLITPLDYTLTIRLS
ncbi:hypothetical protein D3C81_192200 [compost metagenome]